MGEICFEAEVNWFDEIVDDILTHPNCRKMIVRAFIDSFESGSTLAFEFDEHLNVARKWLLGILCASEVQKFCESYQEKWQLQSASSTESHEAKYLLNCMLRACYDSINLKFLESIACSLSIEEEIGLLFLGSFRSSWNSEKSK